MFNYFKEYCNETTLHGFKYFVDEKRSKIEKFVKFILIVSKLSSFFLAEFCGQLCSSFRQFFAHC